MSLDLIIGPMFSGKTTELIRRLNTLQAIGQKCVYVNSMLDSRNTEHFSTHNPLISQLGNINSIKTNSLDIIIHKLQEFDVIGIDESQLFMGCFKLTIINLVESFNKKVIISGLNSDFERNKFGYILDLIPICDDITKLFPYCITCSKLQKITKALFSKRLNNDKNTIDISYDNYIPVCRNCYFN
jgi:thymidine kinase